MDRTTLLAILLSACTAYAFDEQHYSKDGYCPFISHIPLGRVHPHPDEYGFQRVKEGAVATYTCAFGYVVQGNVNRTCINSVHGLRWNGSIPRCVPRRCPPLPSIQNGYIFEGTRFPGSRTLFSCFPSHVIQGARFISCQNNWTYDKPPPRCVRACPLTPPVNNGRFNATYAVIGGVVELFCDRCHNYTIGRFLRCGENGDFELPFPDCRPMLCPNPVGRGTGNIIVDYKCDSKACFDCPSGSVLNGDPNITCLENGTWSGPIPTCVASSDPHTGSAQSIQLPVIEGGCPLPENISNGDYILRLPGLRVGEVFVVEGTQRERNYELDVIIAPLPPEVERIVPEGTVAVYGCNRGYVRQGYNRRACVDGSWMGDLPTCREVMCPLPDESSSGFGFFDTRGTQYGDIARFNCYNGYYSSDDSYLIMCQHDGSWNVTTLPTCTPISCGYPFIYDDVVLKGGDFLYNGRSPTIGCRDGANDSVAVEVQITCLPDGSWDILPFSCGRNTTDVCPPKQNCERTISYLFVGTLLSDQGMYFTVMVKEVVYERAKNSNGLTEGMVTHVRKMLIPLSMTCCNRLQLNEDYLFTGNFNFGMPVSRGCQDIYEYSEDEKGQAFYFLNNGTFSEGFTLCR